MRWQNGNYWDILEETIPAWLTIKQQKCLTQPAHWVDDLLKNKVKNSYNHVQCFTLAYWNKRNTNLISQLTCMQVQRQVSPRPCWWRRSSPGATWPKPNRAKAKLNICFPATFTIQRLLLSPCTTTTIQLTRESGRDAASWEGGKEGGSHVCMLDWNAFWVNPGINLNLINKKTSRF